MKTKHLLLSIGLFLCPFINAQTAGNALNFDGSNDFVTGTIPSIFTNPAVNDFTIETWVQPSTNSFGRIFSVQVTSNTFVSILVNSSGNPYLYVYNNGLLESQNANTTTLPLGQWSHLACTWQASTQTIEIYINGVSMTTTSGGSSSAGNDGSMAIGAKTNGTQVFTGNMDEFRIWDDVRSECEISGSMNTEFTTSQPNLIASYSFNQGIAGGNNAGLTSLIDLTGSYNGTLTNFALTGTTSNWVSSGATVNSTNQNNGIVPFTDVQSSCGSYIWVDGNTYTSSNNTATFTVSNPGGCDTLKTLDLTISTPSTGTDVQSSCNGITWIDGNTYASSNNSAQFTLTNAAGCDSIVTLDFTLLTSSTGTDAQSSCNSITWIDGNTYSSSNNTAQFTLMNSVGCDSVVTLDFTLLPPSTGTDTQIACDSYTWIDGNTYTSNNSSAQFTLANSQGCDSIVTLDLTINSTSATITDNSPSLSAAPSGATYQWIDCDNGNAAISGETNEIFVATANGNYAVIVTENNCSDTSACVNVANVGNLELDPIQFVVYPNPNNGQFTVEIDNLDGSAVIQVIDALGKEIYRKESNQTLIQVNLDLEAGRYFLMVNNRVTSLVIE